MSVTARDIGLAARGLGLSGRPVCVHASLRSFGHLEGGANAVLEGLLGEGCTVLVPSFSYAAFAVNPPPRMRPARNGWDYGGPHNVRARPGSGRVYSPATLEIDPEMGALPAALVATPGRARGRHPLNSFAALGPEAAPLVAGQRPPDVYVPLETLAAAGGAVLLAGVGPTRMTLLHLAEKGAGRVMFRRWANGPDGRPAMAEVGGCSEGFGGLGPALERLAQRAQVGESAWTSYDAQGVLEVAAGAIRANPSITRCDSASCERCRDAVLGGPVLEP